MDADGHRPGGILEAILLLCAPAALLCATAARAQVQQISVAPRISLFRYRRQLMLNQNPAGTALPQACAELDGALYAHAEPSLSDLRLFAASPIGPQERPYAFTSSRTAAAGDQAQVLNTAVEGSRLSFDLAMPPRPYTEVDLDLAGQNFIAAAVVTGLTSLSGGVRPAPLGAFTLFDLSAERLSRSTALPLRESSFPWLHVELTFTGTAGESFTPKPDLIRSAFVPPSREAQALYTTVAETSAITQHPGQTVATLQLPARVPVERIEFILASGDEANFSRSISILATAHRTQSLPGSANPAAERLTGQIARVRLSRNGRDLRLDSLAVPATFALNVNQPVTVEVDLNNAGAPPLSIRAVRLEMRQRRICFDVPQGTVTLFYGADDLDAPAYDFPRLFNPADPTRDAVLAPEAHNPAYRSRPPRQRSFTSRYPELLWLSLLSLAVLLGVRAFGSARAHG